MSDSGVHPSLEGYIKSDLHRSELIKLLEDPYFKKSDLIIVRKVSGAIYDELSVATQLYSSELAEIGEAQLEELIAGEWKRILSKYLDLSSVTRGELVGVSPLVYSIVIQIFPKVQHYAYGGPPSAPFRLAGEHESYSPRTYTHSTNQENESHDYYPKKKRRRGPIYAAVAFAIIAIAGIGLWALSQPQGPYSINVLVFDDKDEDTLIGSGETPLSGVNVYLKNGSGVVYTGKTNSSGRYCFFNITRGSYEVLIDVPSGYANTSLAQRPVYGNDVTFGVVKPIVMRYKYVLHGITGTIQFVVHTNVYNNLRRSSNPYGTVSEVVLRYVNNDYERAELQKLAAAISGITSNKDDQARIAISLVQNIPYDYNGDWEYPYEVLYTNNGICSTKSMLLVCLLRELGYGCAIYDFDKSANHLAAGISAPLQYSYSSGYAFIESTAPTIITYWKSDYGLSGSVHLPSQPDGVIPIYNGSSMSSVWEEYADALTWDRLMGMGQVLDQYNYSLYLNLVNKYGLRTG